MPRVSSDIFGPNLFQLFVDDFGGIKAAAQYLHESPRTVKRWIEKEQVPRSAVLALYWESRYGESQSNCDLVNEIRLYYGSVCTLTTQLNEANATIRALQRMDYGTANQPFFKEQRDAAPFTPPRHGEAKATQRPVSFSRIGERDEGGSAPAKGYAGVQAPAWPDQKATPATVKTLAA